MLLDEYNDPRWPGCHRATDEFLFGKPEKLEMATIKNGISLAISLALARNGTDAAWVNTHWRKDSVGNGD